MRWNWETPFFLSPHNPRVFYAGSNRVMKSVDRGDKMYPISPDLTYNDSMKVRVSTRTTGGITVDATGAETFATVVSLAESYLRPGLLYAGTDDGRTWLTRNDGGRGKNSPAAFPACRRARTSRELNHRRQTPVGSTSRSTITATAITRRTCS